MRLIIGLFVGFLAGYMVTEALSHKTDHHPLTPRSEPEAPPTS